VLVAKFQSNSNSRMCARCSRSAENASEPVRVREGSESLVGYNPLFIYRARFPTSATIVLRSTAERRRGPRGTVLNPAARVYSQPAAVAYRGKLASRSVPTDRGACTGSVPFDACRPGKGGALLASRESGRAREGTPRSPRAHLHSTLDDEPEARGEREARKRKAHATTRDQHEDDSREDDRAGGRDYRE